MQSCSRLEAAWDDITAVVMTVTTGKDLSANVED